MRDYTRELMEVWTREGEQSAFARAIELLRDIKVDIVNAQREAAAIESLVAVLRHRPGVSVAEEPAEPESQLDTILPELRSHFIIDAAQNIVAYNKMAYGDLGPMFLEDAMMQEQEIKVKPQDVLNYLEHQGLALGVQQPLSVIGTVLANSDYFRRIARNTFVKRPPSPSEPEDLPF